jgi:hypothetical protein
MVTFKELRISPDGKKLLVNCIVDQMNIYEDMYIKSIYVEYYKNVNTMGVPSDKAICIYENSEDDVSVKAVKECLEHSNIVVEKFNIESFIGGLFYVYVTCDGVLPAGVSTLPCGYDDNTDVGVILDWKLFYETGMKYIARMAKECYKCDSPLGAENFILLWNALKLAMSTCDYRLIEKYWNKFIRIAIHDGIIRPSGCGCGRG